MKLIERALNCKILEARFEVDRARRQMDNSTNWIGCAFAGWALAKAEASNSFTSQLSDIAGDASSLGHRENVGRISISRRRLELG